MRAWPLYCLFPRSQARVDLLTPVVKGWCTENAVAIASTGIQVHGGVGFIEETGASQYLRDARITTIYEGTTGIQANDLIGRKLAREKGVTLRRLIAAMAADAKELAGGQDADLAAALKRALAVLGKATDWMLEHHETDPRAAAAGAVPYLKLAGTVIGGWLMARAARAAGKKIAAGEGDAGFLGAKRATALYYAAHVLPEAAACGDAILHGAGAVLALEEAQF
jgi:hypothetical protein